MIAGKSPRTRQRKVARVLVICVTLTLALVCRASANNQAGQPEKESGLKVYLPREVTVKDDCPSLGQVGIVRGRDSFVTKASQIELGRISTPGQSIVIDRPTVLSRLASNGIPASMVTLTGAEETTVRQQQRVISSDQFIALASSFLERHRPATSVSQWSATHKPEDFIVPAPGKDLRFSPRLSESSATSQVRVEIAVFAGDRKIGVRDVMFALKYDCRQAVTKTDIAAGQMIGPENVEIQTKQSDYPEPADWQSPYGRAAKRRLAANTVLRPDLMGPLESPTVVKRNQSVVIRIERPGFLITAVGKAMQDGKAGECIKVRNVDSQRIILATINADASVEPAL